MKALVDFESAPIFRIPLVDGTGEREGMLLEGPQGWGEFSPPAGSDERSAARWLTAAVEGGTVGWPDPVRGRIAVAIAVPAIGPVPAHRLVTDSGCRTADVEVAGSPDALAGDIARLEAVRDALGPDGRIRLRAKGTWDVPGAVAALAALTAAAGSLEFVARPCGSSGENAELRRRIETRIAVDVDAPGISETTADLALLRTGPLGGVRRALRLAEQSTLPCVVSSTLETSIGLAAGLALAGALPDLPYACSLGTATLLTGDLVAAGRALVPVDGYLPVAPMPAQPDAGLLDEYALTDPDGIAGWRARLASARAVA